MPLTNLNAALDNLDAATTAHAQALADLAARVAADDISPQEIAASVSRLSASAEAISGFSTTVAGIEPTPVEVPPVEEIPPFEEIPVEELPAEGE